MKTILFLLALILLLPASAGPIKDVLEFVGAGVETESTKLNTVTQYDYAQDGQAIVKIIHGIDRPTTIQETYYFSDAVITGNYTCSRWLIINTCDLYLNYSSQSAYYKHQETNLLGFASLSTGKKNILTSIVVADWTGTTGLAVGVQQISTNLKTNVTIPALRTLPITRVVGTASEPTDIEIQTLTYERYGEYQAQVDDVVSGNIVDKILAVWITLKELVFSLFYILKLIFFDNLILTIALIETFILCNSLDARSIGQWWHKFINAHVAVYEFIGNAVGKIIEIVARVIDALKPL